MNPNTLFLWIVGISCLMTVINVVQVTNHTYRREWFTAISWIVGASAFAYWRNPEWAGYVALVLWLLLLIVPSQLMTRLSYRQNTKNPALGWQYRLMTILHPFGGWRKRLTRWQAWLALDVEDETAVLHYFQTQTNQPDQAQLFAWQLQGEWSRILAWLEMQPDPDMWLNWWLRALGEGGRTEALVQLCQEKGVDEMPVELLVQLFAYCGQVEVVNQLVGQNPLKQYGEPIAVLWQATALQCAGQSVEAHQLLDAHPFPLDPYPQAARQRRLDHPLPKAQLSPQAHAWCEQQAQLWLAESYTYTPFMTFWLIGLNLLVFGWQWQTGALNNAFALFEAGALLPQAVWQNGQWWRLGSATFLHADIWHVALNMLGLYWLGRAVEGQLGWWRFLLVYLGAGLGAGLLIVGLSWQGVLDPSVNVGASGCVLGLLGGLAVLLWRQYQRTGNGRSLAGLREIAIILVLQTAFDLSNPQISFVAHSGGVVIGGLCTFLLTAWQKRPAS